jgi:RimJ/RimL family protein N-acetyltransferase
MIIKGATISLRDWRVSDLERQAYWMRPEHAWQELDGPYYPGPTLDEIPEITARMRAKLEAGDLPTPRTSLAIAKAAHDTLIGCVTWYWESVETNWPAAGISIYDPAYWQRGIGYQALGLWTDYLFRELPTIVRLDLRTWSGNHGMMRLAEKLGYREEARFRRARIVGGQYYDGLGYGVLREEWEQLYPGSFSVTR